MAKKASQPALYEVMRSRHASAAERDQPQIPEIEVSARPSVLIEIKEHWLGPGRAVRLPVGYLLLASGAIILLLILAYSIGVSRGSSTARREAENTFLNSSTAIVNDPLVTLDPLPSGSAARPAGGRPDSLGQAPTASHPSRWGPVVPSKDPRTPGLNYFVLMETTHEGAVRLAAFCRDNGLETYVVRGKNERLRRVVAFPGFESSARTSPEVKKLEAMIVSIGAKWKQAERNNDDLRGFYPLLYTE